MKKIIFDLDNTLIYWKDEYVGALADTIKEYNLNVEVKKIDDIIESLENNFKILNKQILIDCINKKCNLNIDERFVNSLFQKQQKLAFYNQELVDIISYLHSKYELIIYTNYYHEVQAKRLEVTGILKYFTKIYGGDDIPVKPHIKGFNTIIGNNKKDDYIMIGDSIKYDIEGALNAGIKPILYDYKNIVHDKRKYQVIKNLNELKELL